MISIQKNIERISIVSTLIASNSNSFNFVLSFLQLPKYRINPQSAELHPAVAPRDAQ